MRAGWCAGVICATFVAVGMTATPVASAAGSDTVTVKVTASPSAHVGNHLTVSGSVTDSSTGTPAAGAALVITRTDEKTGTQEQLAATAGADGKYSVMDPQPAVWGTESYVVTVTADGSEGHGSLWINRYPTRVGISASRKVANAGRQVRITAHLGSPTNSRQLTIRARPYKREPTVIASDAVDPTSGDLSTTYTMQRRTRFSAHFKGDQKYRPRTVGIVVRARAVIREHLRGGYDTDGAYRLYHAAANPTLAVHMLPELDGVCLQFLAQRYFNGAWHRVAIGCVRTDPDGRAIGVLTGDHHLNSPYRVRARWRGTVALLAKSGDWKRLKFRA